MGEKANQTTAINKQFRSSNDVVEIDLVAVFYAIRKRIWLVIFCALVGASIAAAYTEFLLTPMYTSSSMMIVLTKETTIASIADLQIGAQLTNDYSVLIKSRPVLEETIENLDLDMDYKTLRKHLSVTNESDTRILQLSVTQPDPKLAKQVVDELASVSSSYIADKMEVQAPKIIEEGEIPLQKTSPSLSKNLMVGFVAGLLLASGLIALRTVMSDTVVDEDDVTRYLGITTLAEIPDRESNKKGKRKKSKKEKGR